MTEPGKQEVQLMDHDPRWADMYAQEAVILKNLFGDRILQLDHFGSTSIPGIKAKSTIDILMQTETGEPTEEICSLFASLGYQMRTFPERKEKLFLKEENGLRTFNVHLAEYQGDFVQRMLQFCDVMRRNPELAKEYESAKMQAMAEHPDDRSAYYKRKTQFLKKELGWKY